MFLEPFDNVVHTDFPLQEFFYISPLFMSFKAPLWNWWSLLPATMHKEPRGVHLSYWGYGGFFSTKQNMPLIYGVKQTGIKYDNRVFHFVTVRCQADGNRWNVWPDAGDSTRWINITYRFSRESDWSLESSSLLAAFLSVWSQYIWIWLTVWKVGVEEVGRASGSQNSRVWSPEKRVSQCKHVVNVL